MTAEGARRLILRGFPDFHDQTLAKRAKRRVELVQAGTVDQIEEPIHWGQMTVEPARGLRFVTLAARMAE